MKRHSALNNKFHGGFDSLLSLLDVINSPEKYNEAIETLRTEYERNRQMVELVGPANEIQRLLSQAAHDREDAGRVLDQAQLKANDIRDTQLKKVEDAKKELATQTLVFNKRQESERAKLAALRKELGELENKLKDRENRVLEREAAAESKYVTASKLKDEYDRLVSGIKQYMQ